VRFEADESVPAAAVREVDLQRKFHYSAASLAAAAGLTPPRAHALRCHLGIDAQPSCCHDFIFGKSRHRGYSDNAYKKMRFAVESLDMATVWNAHRPLPATASALPCDLGDCKAE
jgi:hypothetical protein